ncbi:hypothetical protein [Chitinophaga sp. S165]|uniref:hypothetical protein n=1 Tax=Chitinophaga sp. S165 TaxID=2135462 RepID=UPI000D7133CD|nr:hypothetical protein [Chitinophaga sp. S165]
MANKSISSRNLAGLTFFSGIIFLLLNLTSIHSEYYLGEDLVEITVKMTESPADIHTRSTATTRYSLKTAEYPCEFWLSFSAYKLIKDDKAAKKQLDQIIAGDLVTVEIRANKKIYLEQSSAAMPVMGLKTQTSQILDSKKLEQADKKRLMINIGLSILAIIGGILIFFFSKESNPLNSVAENFS